MDFRHASERLTGSSPFPWQESLYRDWFSLGKFPDTCTLPTGLGKASVVAVWLIALAQHPGRMPRRLVYVVSRRTVVDQTRNEVENYRAKVSNIYSEQCAKRARIIHWTTNRGAGRLTTLLNFIDHMRAKIVCSGAST